MKWLTVTIILGVCFVLTLSVGCCHYCGKESTVVTAKDPKEKWDLRVTMRQRPLSGGTRTTLHVFSRGRHQETQLDDDALPGTFVILKYEQWVLILSDGNAWGGYDTRTDEVWGEYEWDRLPFTVWHGSGEVLARKVVSKDGGSPVNYGPFVHDTADESNRGEEGLCD